MNEAQEERVEELLAHAAARLSEALDEAAADAVIAVERYGAKLQTFCKDAAYMAGLPNAWNAMRNRAQLMQKARSTAGKKRVRETQTIGNLTYGMKHAPTSAKAKAIVEALEHDPEIFADPAVINAAALAVSASLGAPPPQSDGTKAAKKRTEQIAFLAYLTSANVNLSNAEESFNKTELTEEQMQAAGQMLDRTADKVASLIARISVNA